MFPFQMLPAAMAAVAGAVLGGRPAPSELGSRDRVMVSGRTYVVTGASSGFGRGTAERLGSYGAKVVLAARRGAVLEEVAARVRALGGQALVVPTDVSDPEQVEALARAALGAFGAIDVWINDAAVASIGRFEEIPIADHARMVDVNLKGAIYGSHVALRQFRRQGHGVLVNISSVEGDVPLAYHATYAATKHAMLGLDGAIRQELRLGGLERVIRVATIQPWAVDTPYWVHAGNYTGRLAQTGLMDDPREVVDAIVWNSVHPNGPYQVGWKARAAVLGDRIAPRLAERIAGGFVQRTQMDDAPPGPVTSGNLHRPMAEGTGVEGGIRKRMGADRGGR
ncbi:SDR family NAD(P)-dependent oxidoreductase [Pararoseomonas sp. SCSIO 73927]|uniref:SDR family NAD(P)-dependent oxidoreductase n=1 Tax=Pararoseomonas sp. SCSIO 73927 TaxID=3114537 RepID=UPI0030CAED19